MVSSRGTSQQGPLISSPGKTERQTVPLVTGSVQREVQCLDSGLDL